MVEDNVIRQNMQSMVELGVLSWLRQVATEGSEQVNDRNYLTFKKKTNTFAPMWKTEWRGVRRDKEGQLESQLLESSR